MNSQKDMEPVIYSLKAALFNRESKNGTRRQSPGPPGSRAIVRLLKSGGGERMARGSHVSFPHLGREHPLNTQLLIHQLNPLHCAPAVHWECAEDGAHGDEQDTRGPNSPGLIQSNFFLSKAREQIL